MHVNITPSQVSDRLNGQADSIARELLPQGKKQGRDWVCGNVQGEPGESLKVCIEGEKAGVCADFATGWSGDLLDLYCETRGVGLGDAMKWSCKLLGIERPDLRNGPEKVYKEPDRAGLKTLPKATPVIEWFKSRGIDKAVLDTYGVVAKGSDTAAFPHLRDGKLVHIQYRSIHEKKFYASEGTELTLFGWDAIPPKAREVVICEGHVDALSWAQYGFPAMSVPNGAGGNGKQRWIENDFERMSRFDRVLISMDADKPGEEAAAAICERLGRHRCFVIRLPSGYKDVNDCLQASVPKEIIADCVAKAQTVDPEELRNAGHFLADVIEHFHPAQAKPQSILSPFEGHVDTFSFHYGATSVLAGRNGSGKSTIIGQIVLEAGLQGVHVCVASLEFRVPRYLGWLVRQGLPDARPDQAKIEFAISKLANYLWAFATYGEADIEKIVAIWDYAHARYGCRLFVLDNFSKLSFSGGEKDELKAQKDAITLITEFAVRTNTHVIVAAHPRKGASEHEEVSKMDVKGNGALTDLVDDVLILTRNKKKERAIKDPHFMAALEAEEAARIESSPDAFLSCEKHRHGEQEPRIVLWWDAPSHQYVNRPQGAPRRFLK